ALYPALAFGARAAVAVGSRGEGTMLANELLSLWTRDIDAFPSSSWAVDLAYALDALGRAADLIQTASRVTTWTRWLGALDALLLGDAPTAASRFAEIGSRPDEALARLRAA